MIAAKLIVLAGSLALLANQQAASDANPGRWKGVSGTNAFTVYIDGMSVRERAGLRTAWFKFVYHPVRGQTAEHVESDEIDCYGRTMRLMSMTNYDAQGNALLSPAVGRQKAEPVVPESVSEGMLTKACDFLVDSDTK